MAPDCAQVEDRVSKLSAASSLASCPALHTDKMHHHGPSMGLRRQSWGQMLTSRLSTASQWPSGQVLVLGEQVEKFLVIPVREHTAGCHPTWAQPTTTLSWSNPDSSGTGR